MRFIWGFITAVLLGVLVGLWVTYSGSYHVAANVADPAIVKWLLSTNMERSVTRHAQKISVPPTFSEQQVRQGIAIYTNTCIHCHGAPGKDWGDIAKGLNPVPPNLALGRWSSAELFWIIKNGIKMSGMASYGAVHNDDEIWTLVAFVQRLPAMTPEQYDRMQSAGAGATDR